jgi:hypothetical protein
MRETKTHVSTWGRFAPKTADAEGYIYWSPAVVNRLSCLTDVQLNELYKQKGVKGATQRAILVIRANRQLANQKESV